MRSNDARSSDGTLFAPDAELEGTTVLIVDDDPDTLEVMQQFLASYGVAVATATGADEAFAGFEAQRPDLVISDVHMPGTSGLDLIRRIRGLPPERGGLTPAIAVSGAAEVEETLAAGFHYLFAKPISAQVLIAAIRSFVRSEPHGRDTWSLGVDDGTITIRWEGDITSADVRAMVDALVSVLDSSAEPCRVVNDVRRLRAFTPSVGAAAQLAAWRARAKIASVVVVGGSTLARAISRSACLVLGIPCSFATAPPA